MYVLIVGAGLGGISLAHRFEKENIPFKLIDSGKNYSSKVAAGMINPMSFRRMLKSWRADDFIPVLSQFYENLEEKLACRFFHPIALRRIFSTAYERALWQQRLDEEGYDHYLSEPDNKLPDYLNAPFGSGMVKHASYIDAASFIENNQQYFLEANLLQFSTFDFTQFDAENLTYQKEKYSHFIFAEGFQGENNPYFNYLPFKNAKGEMLTFTSDSIGENEIYNRKCIVLPVGNKHFKLGSSYEWNTQDPRPTEKAKKTILENYNHLSTADIQIVDHQAGIRPVSADRRPLLGEHPTHKGVYIFNGLGAKGYMLAPYFSKEFVLHLIIQKPLAKEVDIRRFEKRFLKSDFTQLNKI